MTDYHQPDSELTEVMAFQPLGDGFQLQLRGYAGGDGYEPNEWRERVVVTNGDITLTLMDEVAASQQPIGVYNTMADSLEELEADD